MEFISVMPFLAATAYLDYKSREIPQWSMALLWLSYGLGLAVFTPPFALGIFANVMIILALGFLWTQHVVIETLYKAVKKDFAGKMVIRHMRIGLGDVFILPIMFPVVAQFGVFNIFSWMLGTVIISGLWFMDLKKGNRHRKKGIPFITFAFISLIIVSIVAMWGGSIL